MTDATRAEICVVAVAEVFRGDGEILANPIGNVPMTITKARRVPVRWNGEEKRGLDNNGASYNIILRDQFAQAMRTLCNEVEADIAALYTSASRAAGTSGRRATGAVRTPRRSAGARTGRLSPLALHA